MGKSSVSRRRRKCTEKPKKPYENFPLGTASNGRWQKRINGKLYYFGPWGKVVDGKLVRIAEDGAWKAALDLYLAQKDDLYAGRTPRVSAEGLTIADLCNRFLTSKKRLLTTREITARTFAEYKST